MKKYKVTFYLMVNPVQGDQTFPKSYTVTANSERDAYELAEKEKDNDEPDIAKRSVFNFKVREL